jgi:nicotinate-nucleotide pyrophosphorylase (carboxylating)
MSELNVEQVSELIAPTVEDRCRALAEDVGSGDLTAQLIPATQTARARVITREAAVIAGRPWFDACFKALDPDCVIDWRVNEGDSVAAGDVLVEISGNARALLTAERPALNFLQTLSAVATATRPYVEAVRGTHAAILDTRKTLPGLRLAEKYAVRVGGGVNQRTGLYDGILIKENHIAAAGGIAPVLEAAFKLAEGKVSVQIEVETLDQLTGARRRRALVLLDNFSLDDMRHAVQLAHGRALLEASGNITLETCARWPKPGSTAFRSAASPSTSARWTCRCASIPSDRGRSRPLRRPRARRRAARPAGRLRARSGGRRRAARRFRPRQLIAELAARPFVFSVLAFDGDTPVGLVNAIEGFSTFACRPLVNVHDVVVIDSHRGRGIAARLFAEVEAIARERGACKLTLCARRPRPAAAGCSLNPRTIHTAHGSGRVWLRSPTNPDPLLAERLLGRGQRADEGRTAEQALAVLEHWRGDLRQLDSVVLEAPQ